MRREDPKYVEKRKKFMAMQKAKSQDKFNKGGLSPKQKVIAAKAPPPNKITGADFAAMKKEKVMKARVGKSIDKKAFEKTIGVFPTINTAPGSIASKAKAMKKSKGAGLSKLGKVAIGKAGRIGALLGVGAVGLNMAGRKLKKVLDERKARKRDTAKVKKMGGGLAAATAKLKAQGRMGGGMMKPMGYKSGKSVKAKCKLGKNKPTKLY